MTDDPEHLVDFLMDAKRVRNDMWRQEPSIGTRAHTDLELSKLEFGGSLEPGSRIYELANLWLLIAAEELRGIGVLIGESGSWPAMFPLIRACVENCGAVLWLVGEPSFRKRAARAAVAILDSKEKRVGAVGLIANPKEQREVKLDRDAFLATLNGEFTDIERDPWRVGGERMPRPTAFADCVGDRKGDRRTWGAVYAYLCMMGTHPSIGFGGLLQPSGEAKAQIAMTDAHLEQYLRWCAEPFFLAFGSVASAMGRERRPFDEYFQRYVEVLG